MKHLKSDFPEVDFKAEFCDERIYLSPLSTDDVTERYHSWLVDQKVNAFLEVRGNELTLDDIREYITQGPASGAYYMYAIRTLDTDLHIGNVKIGPIQWTHRVADLPVIIGDRVFWGKGIATEAIRLGNRLAFEFYDLRKLQGQIYRGNVGSIKAYCRAGWIIEGVVRGRYLVDGKPMDQVIVSCNNSNYIPAQHDDYSIDTLRELIDFRNTL